MYKAEVRPGQKDSRTDGPWKEADSSCKRPQESEPSVQIQNHYYG